MGKGKNNNRSNVCESELVDQGFNHLWRGGGVRVIR